MILRWWNSPPESNDNRNLLKNVVSGDKTQVYGYDTETIQ
jgi:hypothetical protein